MAIVRSIKSQESIIVDGPAVITMLPSRPGRVVLRIDAPRETTVSNRKRPSVSLDDFPSLPQSIGTTNRVLSHDGRWMLIRYPIYKGRMARFNEDAKLTALFFASVDEFDLWAKDVHPGGWDSWAPKLFWLMAGTIESLKYQLAEASA